MSNETTAPVQSLHDQIMRLPCTPPKDANVNQMLAYKSGHRDARHAAAELAAGHEADARKAAPVAVPDGEAIREAIREALGDAYDCTRVWSAWGYGTMSQNDFESVAGNDERVDEIACAVEQVISAAPTPPAQQQNQQQNIPKIIPAVAPVAVPAIDVVQTGATNWPGGHVPDGWKLVPITPTSDMLDEFDSVVDFGADDSEDAWARLLAAAPTTPTGQCESPCTPPAQQLDLKLLCTHFYYWWHNQPGTNTEHGFDAWFEAHGRALLSIHSDTATSAQQPVAVKSHGAWDGLELLAEQPDGTELYAAPPAQQGQLNELEDLQSAVRTFMDLFAHTAPINRQIDVLARLVGWNGFENVERSGDTAPPAPEQADPQCQDCGGSGDVHRPDGEWMGKCKRCKAEQPKCKTCGGTGFVDDGEIWCSEDGTPYENGPVKCMKDCPDCTAAEQGAVTVPTETLRKIHRDLDACQRVIHYAGGFDPAYVKDAQERLKEIDELLEGGK